jgi:hypothetical protein
MRYKVLMGYFTDSYIISYIPLLLCYYYYLLNILYNGIFPYYLLIYGTGINAQVL